MSFEALKSGTGFFSLAVKVLDGILLLTESCFFYTENLLFGEATLTISGRSSETGASSSALLFHPELLWYAGGFFSLKLMNQPLLASNLSPAASSFLSAFTELKRGWGLALD